MNKTSITITLFLLFFVFLGFIGQFLLNRWRMSSSPIKINGVEGWKRKYYEDYEGCMMFFHPQNKEIYFGYKIHDISEREFRQGSLKLRVEVEAGECDEVRDIVVDKELTVQNYFAKEYILECRSGMNYFIIRYVGVFNKNKNQYAHFSFTAPKKDFEEIDKKFSEILENFIWE